MRIASLDRSQLASAKSVLAASCAFDRADVVADEKLFGLGSKGAPIAIGAWMSSDELATLEPSTTSRAHPDRGYGGDVLVGVAALCGNRIRVLAVSPAARGRGIGSALLTACEDTARASGVTALRTLDEPGNYLAPGIDERNTETIGWLERRGWQRSGELRENVLIAVRENPRVTRERADSLAAACAVRGYEVRRARPDEHALLDAVASEFGGAWPFELARSLELVSDVMLAGSSTRAEGTMPGDTTRAEGTVSVGGTMSAGDTTRAEGTMSAGDTTRAEGTTSAGDTTRAEGTTSAGGATRAEGTMSAGRATRAAGPMPAGGATRTAGPMPAGGATRAAGTMSATGPMPAGGATRTEGTMSATGPMPGVHVALRDGVYCAFAAHDGNNAGLGWFGPTGTWPAHRGNGLGEALLVACLVDVAAAHEHCEVAWIGPRPFYDKVAGVVSDRRFVLLVKSL